jgi:hypothetical protein
MRDVLMAGQPSLNPEIGIVESVFAPAMREINALESRIVVREDEADALLWEQAAEVVRQLDAGMSQRDLAAQWINVRTGEPYSQMHVSYTRTVVEKLAFQIPRPRFRDAYNEIAHAARRKTPDPPLPFHWMNAADDLFRLSMKHAASWPPDARPTLPRLLRQVADRIDYEVNHVGRGPRFDGADADPGGHERGPRR